MFRRQGSVPHVHSGGLGGQQVLAEQRGQHFQRSSSVSLQVPTVQQQQAARAKVLTPGFVRSFAVHSQQQQQQQLMVMMNKKSGQAQGLGLELRRPKQHHAHQNQNVPERVDPPQPNKPIIRMPQPLNPAKQPACETSNHVVSEALDTPTMTHASVSGEVCPNDVPSRDVCLNDGCNPNPFALDNYVAIKRHLGSRADEASAS